MPFVEAPILVNITSSSVNLGRLCPTLTVWTTFPWCAMSRPTLWLWRSCSTSKPQSVHSGSEVTNLWRDVSNHLWHLWSLIDSTASVITTCHKHNSTFSRVKKSTSKSQARKTLRDTATINQRNQLRQWHKFIEAKIDASTTRVVVMVNC